MTRLERDLETWQQFVELRLEGRTLHRVANRKNGTLLARQEEFETTQAAQAALEKHIENCLVHGFTRPGEAPPPLPDDESGMDGFEISWAKALARLEGVLAGSELRSLDRLARRNPSASVLWVDEPWAEIDYEAMAARQSVALAVFEDTFACDGPLVLSAQQVLGDPLPRNDRTFVFLREVTADAMTTLPDTTAIFMGGLRLSSTGCFSAPDASSFVACRLVAPTIVSGEGDGWMNVLPGTEVEVELLCGTMQGADVAIPTAESGEAFSRWAERMEDESLWEIFVDAFSGGLDVVPDPPLRP